MSIYKAPFGEVDEPKEKEIEEAILTHNRMMMKKRSDRSDRAQHPKGHGYLSATFEVSSDVPDELRHGIFAKPGMYDAKIRFSNGFSYDDTEDDLHGMAIKVLGVGGPKLLSDMEGQEALDFILLDNETFMKGSLEDYEQTNDIMAEIFSLARNGENWLSGTINKLLVGLDRIRRKITEPESDDRPFAPKPAVSALATQYWSATPYHLGPNIAVKYTTIPMSATKPGKIENENGITNALVESLGKGTATFKFSVLLQPDYESHPVDRPGVSWLTGTNSPVDLATITIAQTDRASFAKTQAEGEQTAFNPWNTLEAHKPLGAINRVRRRVYHELSKERTKPPVS